MGPVTPKAMSGRSVSELSVEGVCHEDLQSPDIRIHPDTLHHQAARADRFGNPQLAENLRRGAEIALLEDSELMHIYDALRPGRSTVEEMRAIAAGLDSRDMPRIARLVGEAADMYARRNMKL